ncbi:hypothetical protein FE391_30355 [Nonomuraea sp. KC401]|uniref:hypothetical protein n=1 Tax=unclassified Nonomuraea TaxID=2593643 RepID=UPI0010FE5A2D|nr:MULTISPECIES: hypothetical protein [unclassified Nonomuraea]NBE97190.1 hypothetical protein [Nonomuraea sp. K271]TLF62324.1 hypothetical protein FE391_30355 [Nonomuraea sp. KC401]
MTINPYAGSPSSYVSEPAAAPYSIVELMPGVRNLCEYVRLVPGERVLLLMEHTVDPVVVQAIAAGAAFRGADVRILSVAPFSAGGWDRDAPLQIETAAFHEADVVISGTWWGEVHTAPLFFDQIKSRSARFLSLHMTATAGALLTGGRLPAEVFYALLRRALRQLSGAGRIRVTSGPGTDVTFSGLTFDPDPGALRPGDWRPFPYGGANFWPADTEGVITIEDSTVTGVPEEPVRLTLEGNLVRKIEGGSGAERLRRYAPEGFYMRHGLIGLNPKVRIAGGTQFEREKHAGAFYCGIDGLTGGEPVTTGPGFAHCDCQMDRPTVTVDGELFIEQGRLLLLDEPEIQEVAARFGPPEVVLDDNPVMILPRRYAGLPA